MNNYADCGMVPTVRMMMTYLILFTLLSVWLHFLNAPLYIIIVQT